MEEVWISSEQNCWSAAYPASIAIGVILILCTSLINNRILKLGLGALLIMTFSILATISSGLQISEKWRIRQEWYMPRFDSLTDLQRSIATADGANKSLGPFLFGFDAYMIFLTTFITINLIPYFIRKFKQRQAIEQIDP
ncbi:MAG: hypothetical protein COA79_22290 [Planctomycetota bacterium]|nr:MAG: hypothetical protein COA79_22290 [Planctomycetota bacterium]